jgi:hypothetical protein
MNNNEYKLQSKREAKGSVVYVIGRLNEKRRNLNTLNLINETNRNNPIATLIK